MAHVKLDAAKKARVRALHAGEPDFWTPKVLAAEFGVSVSCIYDVLDGRRACQRDADRRNKMILRDAAAGRRAAGLDGYCGPSARQAHALRRRALQAIEADTRTLAEQHCGDPPPGRSALDRRENRP